MSSEANTGKIIGFSAVGGIIGGIIMGILAMAASSMGLMSFSIFDVASNMIFNKVDLVMGWLIHLMMSLVYGIVFGIIIFLLLTQFGQEEPDVTKSLIIGLVYGFILMIIAAMVMMLMPPEVNGEKIDILANMLDPLMMLVAHLVYGAVTGVVYFYLNQQYA